MDGYNIAEAKAGFSALVERAEAGETIDILRRGRLVARLTPAKIPARKPVDVAALRALQERLRADGVKVSDYDVAAMRRDNVL